MNSEKEQRHFAVCIKNDGYSASLEVGKLYQVVPDAAADAQGYIRIIDESGDDYGYSKDRFFPIDIPIALQEALAG
ncbi:hypothetical protein [Thiospirillum jenense]|uniref:Uncharacterized protein n=1 Tax=Thiospirillum jenense TaxID=1653858 RepID=A0A839HG31_9GAMM|nr:hypothetical protein [Thiospirillum jenense]MBB1126990.1 hypothetical protein [Thiospirillum jenense]